MTEYFQSFGKDLAFAFLEVELLFEWPSTDFSNAFNMFFISSLVDEYVIEVEDYTLVHYITEYMVHKLDHRGGCLAVVLLHNPAG